ncbi:MAG: hypothetical protein Q7R70_04685 [Candidatus Diapherotrites archaeon]|nr:hypothetical protein [Candidatus Diapherotrites archaeon]
MKKGIILSALIAAVLVLAVVLAFGCIESQPLNPPILEKDSCIQNSDCVKTVLSPCPCNSGGKEEAVNKEWLANYAWPDDDAQPPVCLQVYLCTDKTAKCTAGKCVLEQGANA